MTDPTIVIQNKSNGNQNETIASGVLGLKKTAGSGCGNREKGDLGSGSDFFVEAKVTSKSRMLIKTGWFNKAIHQAKTKQKRIVLLQLAFVNRFNDEPKDIRFVAVRSSDLIDQPNQDTCVLICSGSSVVLDQNNWPKSEYPFRIIHSELVDNWLVYPETWFSESNFIQL